MNILKRGDTMTAKQKKWCWILGLFLLLWFGTLFGNKFHSDFKDLKETDQKMIQEYSAYVKADQKKKIWVDDPLTDNGVLAINGFWGHSYMFPHNQKLHSLYATPIKNAPIRVYRVSRFTPQILKLKLFGGNFNTIGKTTRLFGEPIYYVKYSADESLKKRRTSRHFMPFLAHESLHYYNQNHWAGGERFEGELSAQDLKLLREELEILTKMQTILTTNENPAALPQLTKDYVAVMKKRIKSNPEYLKKEMAMETAEGSATYMGIRAAKIVGYNFGVMDFDNARNVPFNEVSKAYREGKIDGAFLRDELPYQTGALLCLLMDRLPVPHWQEQLNAQTEAQPVTLFSILERYVKRSGF